MSSHRRLGVLARALGLRRSPNGAVLARRVGIDVVDARTWVAHLVSSEELRAGRGAGGLPGALWRPTAGGEPDRPGAWPLPGVRVMSCSCCGA